MKKVNLLFAVISGFVLFILPPGKGHTMLREDVPVNTSAEKSLYEELQLAEKGLNESTFNKAIKGWNKLKNQHQLKNQSVLSIVDFSKSSKEKRLYIIDLEKNKLLYNTYVAHGKNSGEEFAQEFANQEESLKSSLGFYLTGQIYQGKHGVSLKLKGIEQGINDKAEQRGIVIHGADYVSDEFISKNGRLGRSFGCPALPLELTKPIIDKIKEGSCLFIYHPDPAYHKKTSVL